MNDYQIINNSLNTQNDFRHESSCSRQNMQPFALLRQLGNYLQGIDWLFNHVYITYKLTKN